MPSQQEVKWSQLKVGVIVLISVTLLCVLLFLMTSASGMSVFSHKIIIHTYFDNSGGLKVGAPIELEGVTVGEVTHVTVTTDPARKLTPVLIKMKIDPKYLPSLHKDTTAALATVGVLGDTVVDLNSKLATGPELQSGDELRTTASPSLNDVIKTSQGTVADVDVVLKKLDLIESTIISGKGTAGKLITDPSLYNKANDTITQLHELLASLNSGKGSLGKLVHDDELYNKLNDTSTKLDAIVTSLNEGKGTAGKLLKDDALYNDLDSTLKHANSLLAEADRGQGTLGLFTKDPAFAHKLDATVTHLNTLLGNVNSGKGTLGKLATDDAAYSNLNRLLTSSNDLVTAVRQDPKKYLVIHLRVF
ncbi:MCE family protein [Granulicella sp. 5B5]|uniref:MlaD family protein n=1 Tax=Granulicella sp. 5B5 TaxID=1617967 RepID=UPI0015F69B68|nr:MlaD family protein [Granulicella sp. 5B5]QMV19073.1 MCE family protein [Granulicella sp. 5B5]